MDSHPAHDFADTDSRDPTARRTRKSPWPSAFWPSRARTCGRKSKLLRVVVTHAPRGNFVMHRTHGCCASFLRLFSGLRRVPCHPTARAGVIPVVSRSCLSSRSLWASSVFLRVPWRTAAFL